jgi:manganese oxidase
MKKQLNFFYLILIHVVCAAHHSLLAQSIQKFPIFGMDPKYPWKDPKIAVSSPPGLMEKQMGSVITPGIKPLGHELDGTVKVFRLIAQPIKQIICDDQPSQWSHLIPEKNKAHLHPMKPFKQVLKCWGYNGSTPGPTLEATEGDTVRIIVKNELPEPTSIHWHGFLVPNNQDGATPETAPPILPGQTYTYEFTIKQSGTLMYHSGFNPMKQDDYGLMGFFVVHPKNGYEQKIDQDIAIFLQQFAIRPGNVFPDLTTMNFNWFLFNGYAAPLIPMLTVNEGERVRLRFANTIMNSHPIHLHGFIWEEVGTEGGPIPKTARRKGSTINVPPGTTRDVEFVANNPGLWRLHCHKLHHITNAHTDVPLGIMNNGGMFTILNVIPRNY